jgi:hypothetical protein
MDNMFENEFTDELKQDYLTSAVDGFNFSVDNFGIDVLINGIPSKVLLKNKKNGNDKEISAKINEIHVGDLIEMNSQKWLIVDLPVENEIYSKATLRRCNTYFPIIQNRTRELIGYDGDERPTYSYSFETYSEPCIASTTYPTGNDNEQLPLPEGTIDITIKYQMADNIAVNENFQIYSENYETVSIDYTKVIDSVGVMTIRGRREVSG